MRPILAVWLALGIMGCEVEGIDESDVSESIAAGKQLNGKKLNGKKLNGKKLNGVKLNGVKLSGVQLPSGGQVSITLQRSRLVYNNTDIPNGTIFTIVSISGNVDGRTDYTKPIVQLRVDNKAIATTSNVSAKPSNADVYYYYMSYRMYEPTMNAWTEWGPLCPEPERVGEIPGPAIAVSGRWDVTNPGGKDPGTDGYWVTFSCRDGAMAKCIEGLGYKPWLTGIKFSGQEISMDKAHQACVRMIRGDYCGNGWATTLDGTAIDAWDGAPLNVRTDPTYGFEAEWQPWGAKCLGCVRWNLPISMVETKCNPDGSCYDVVTSYPSVSAYVMQVCSLEAQNRFLRYNPNCSGSNFGFTLFAGTGDPDSYIANGSSTISSGGTCQ